MSGPLIIAVPSKGRLQENAAAFFARAGLPFVQNGAREYRARIGGLDDVEIALLSASEIVGEVAAGRVHLGITGLDLVHESVPELAQRERLIHIVQPLGFGHADVVVAVPKAWIDVRAMADLADIAHDFRARHGRWLRVATKYIHLARAHFDAHGIVDYRIVESLGATEGAPAAGSAELIVDITTTGSTLAANALKIVEDGVILRSEAHLVAARTAEWSDQNLATVRAILDRILAEARARAVREIRTRLNDAAEAGRAAAEAFGGSALVAEGSELVLHCPARRVYDCVAWLKGRGAKTVGVFAAEAVFEPENPLADRLAAAVA